MKTKNITKKEFLKDAERAWNNACEYNPETYTIIFSGEYSAHYGLMSCEEIFLWATDHLISKRTKRIFRQYQQELRNIEHEDKDG